MQQLDMGFEQEYASKEERWFGYYVSELIEGGWIKEAIYQPNSFLLSEKHESFIYVKKKNHNEIKNIKLLNEHKYTSDWFISWNKKAEGVFYWLKGGVYEQGSFPYSKPRKDAFIPFKACVEEDEIYSYIDVKGEFGRNGDMTIFSINQKWMMQKTDLFIQKIVVSLSEKGLFYRTYFPRNVVIEEVYKRDYVKKGKTIAKKGDSKIKVVPKLLQHFIKK